MYRVSIFLIVTCIGTMQGAQMVHTQSNTKHEMYKKLGNGELIAEPLAQNSPEELMEEADKSWLGIGQHKDYANAVNLYERILRSSIEEFMRVQIELRLGEIFEEGGHGVVRNGKKAVDYFKRVLASPEAYNAQKEISYEKLGDIYFYGKEVPKNYLHALKNYHQAVNHVESSSVWEYIQFQRAQIYFWGGYGVQKQKDKARELFEQLYTVTKNDQLKASVAGFLGAINYFGFAGFAQDWKTAAEMYQFVVDHTDNDQALAEANLILGKIYFEGGHKLKRDRAQAQRYLFASQRLEAEYMLGEIAFWGGSAEGKNWRAAQLHFKRALASDATLTDAQRARAELLLGHTYYIKQHGITETYPRKAREHYQNALNSAAASDYVRQQAHYHLALLGELDAKSHREYEQVAQHLKAAIEGAEPKTLFTIHMKLGDLYATGKLPGEQAYAHARDNFEFVAEQRAYPLLRAQAELSLGHLYRIGGNGIAKDLARARNYFERADKQTEDQDVSNLAGIELNRLDRYEKHLQKEKCEQAV